MNLDLHTPFSRYKECKFVYLGKVTFSNPPPDDNDDEDEDEDDDDMF